MFPALEALLPRVAKPVQYVGGELNAQVRSWEAAAVRWALLYPDAYEIGLPNQGLQILYEILNERPDALAERCYAVWPDLEALMREARRAAVLRRRAPPDRRVRPARRQLLDRARLHQPAHHARPRRHPAARRRPRRRATRWSSPAGTPRSTRSRSRTSSTSRRSATARRSSATSPRSSRAWKAAGRPGGRRELLLRLAATPRRATSRRSTTVSYAADGAIAEVAPDRPARAADRAEAHRPPTSTPGRTRRRRWCRWPRPCTSGPASRSSAAAPAAAASARPG